MAFEQTTPPKTSLPDAVQALRARVSAFKPLPGAGWQRLETPLAPLEIKEVLQAQEAPPLVYWQARNGLEEAGAVGMADEIRSDDWHARHQFPRIDQALLKDLPARMRYFGGAAFDARHCSDDWAGFPSLWFVLPRLEIRRTGQAFTLALHCRADGSDLPAAVRALATLVIPVNKAEHVLITARRDRDLPDRSAWQQGVKDVLQSIESGLIRKAVLARRTDLTLGPQASAFDVLRALQAMTPGCYHFLFQPAPEVCFYGASPERLYARAGRQVQSEAMAGTRPAGNSPQELERYRDELTGSVKEIQEQAFVLSAVREALAALTVSVRVDGAIPRVVQVMGGQHLVTGLDGELAAGVNDADILACLHPTPAVAGVPLDAALTMLRQVEPFARGWYAGPVGWLGRDESEFAVAIRSGLVRGNRLSVFAGAGIVTGSDPFEEWLEVEHKISATLKILSL